MKASPQNSFSPSSRQAGFTLVELLVVVAITGVILTIGAISGRNSLRNSEEAASVRSIEQSIWQAASAASARGRRTVLSRSGNQLTISELDNGQIGKTVRRFELASSVTTNLPSGQILTFLPPGQIEQSSYDDLEQPITITTSKGKETQLSISLIGEVYIGDFSSLTQEQDESTEP